MWTARFWLSLAERALKTFAQVMVAQLLVGDRVLGLLDVNWPTSLSVAGLATVVSALTSIASAGIGPDGSPSLVGEPAKVPESVVGDDPDDEVVHTGDNPVDSPTVGIPAAGGRHVDDGEPHDIPARRLTQRRREP